MFTSIHRVLGAAPGPLTWRMIEQLVEQQAEEVADLDFKQILPTGEWRDEAAKDFAAMANSGGGVVLYGVAEARGYGTANGIKPLEVKEADVRSLTQVAYNLVHPPLMDIRPVKVTDPQHPALSVLAIVVQPSADVPHMYWKKDAFLAPVRHGSDTRWMDERQIEQAYLTRFEGRRKRQMDLAGFYDETLAHTMPSRKTCVVAVATPSGVRGTDGYPEDDDGLMEVFYSALRSSSTFIRSDSSIFTNFSFSPSIGLRRWRWRTNKGGDSNHLLEFHRDGSVAMVIDIGDEFIDAGSEAARAAASDWKPQATSLAVEFALAGLAAFLSAVAPKLHNDGGYEVRTGITWDAGSEGSLPLEMYLSYDRRQHASNPEVVRHFTPVHGLLRAGRVDELQADLHLLCTDVLNQTGIDSISLLNTHRQGTDSGHERIA